MMKVGWQWIFTSNLDTVKFNKVLESFSLVQHVNGPTHKKGHTLDVIITRAADELVTSIETRDPMLSDHLLCTASFA